MTSWGTRSIKKDSKLFVASNISIFNSKGKLSGGAIYAYNTTLVELESCKILENSAGPGGGGALYATGLDTIHLDGTTVANNTAKGSGGALALRKVFQMKVENSKLEENHSQKSGGGAHLESVQEVWRSIILIGAWSGT